MKNQRNFQSYFKKKKKKKKENGGHKLINQK